ncbi:uncharacterized protein LOC144472352 [Augochlora pura]
MAAVEIFSSSVNYKYKSKICSLSFFVVFISLILSFLTPFFIISYTGGFYLVNRVYAEKPDVLFNYKYMLLAYRDYKINPIVCSVFATYKRNKITDDCILIKVQEVDTNSDGVKDILKFEAQFYTDTPIKNLMLLLFFNFKLKSARTEKSGARTMSTRSKEKVVAAFRKFFRSSEKISDQEAASSSTSSPSRRLLSRHHRPDAVTPSDGALPENSTAGNSNHGTCFFKSKKSSGTPAQGTADVPDKRVCLRRLMKELGEIQKTQHRLESTFTAELVNDNLFEWHVRLHKIDPESELAADMRELNIPYILLHVVFPENFPFAPPFMRVISPRIEKGFVMEGGAICMELLTPRGWASAYTIEAVITQFAASIVKGQGRVARKPKSNKEFNRRSAEESFRSLVKTHEKYGWVTPPLAEG